MIFNLGIMGGVYRIDILISTIVVVGGLQLPNVNLYINPFLSASCVKILMMIVLMVITAHPRVLSHDHLGLSSAQVVSESELNVTHV